MHRSVFAVLSPLISGHSCFEKVIFRRLKRKHFFLNSIPGNASLTSAKSVPASPPSAIASTLVPQGVATGVAEVPAIGALPKSAAQNKKS